MKRIIVVLVLMTSCIIQAQETETCFDAVKLEPAFIAFSTSKDSKLGTWYQETFGLEIVKEFSFPDGSVTGVLMKRDEFVVELFYRKNGYDTKDYVPNSKSDEWKGFMKFGMYTNANLKELRDCLKKKGVNAGRIYNDKNLKVDLLQVIDPEGNVLEIISRHVK